MSSSTASSSTPNFTLVNVGTHSLALYAYGPEPSNANDPVVLFVSGVASSSLNWAAVVRLLPPSIRSYTYDRSGFGNSEVTPVAPTAENIALELSQLIQNAPIKNPIILVGHSWAGVLISEFIALNTGAGNEDVSHIQVAGVVLVDANHETQLQVLNPDNDNLQAISAGVDHYSAKGIAAEHKMTKEEWDAFMAEEATEKYEAQAQKEDDEYRSSFDTLLKKELKKRQPLLGDRPVYVIGGMRSRDWGRMYKAGVEERGNGTEEQRRKVRELIEVADGKSAGLMHEWLKITKEGRGKVVFAKESGHFIQLTQPEMVVEGVEWVLGEMHKTSD